MARDLYPSSKNFRSAIPLTITTWDRDPYWACDGEDPEGNVFQLRMKNH